MTLGQHCTSVETVKATQSMSNLVIVYPSLHGNQLKIQLVARPCYFALKRNLYVHFEVCATIHGWAGRSVNFILLPCSFTNNLEIRSRAPSETISGNGIVETTVVSINSRVSDRAIVINGDIYSIHHWILARKDGVIRFVSSSDIDTTYEVYNFQTLDWVEVQSAESIAYIDRVYTINCEPYDMFFTNSMLVYDRVETD